MDYKRTNAPLNTVTRDLNKMAEQTGNVYESVCIIARRANEIAVEIKKDLEKKLQEFKTEGKVIEARAYNTVYGVWTYFTADDGQIELWQYDYLVIGTIESYYALKEYFGDDVMVPLYIEVEDGLRLSRALERERAQTKPQYAELCRRFLADAEDFSEENLERAGIKRRFQNNSSMQNSKVLKSLL